MKTDASSIACCSCRWRRRCLHQNRSGKTVSILGRSRTGDGCFIENRTPSLPTIVSRSEIALLPKVLWYQHKPRLVDWPLLIEVREFDLLRERLRSDDLSALSWALSAAIWSVSLCSRSSIDRRRSLSSDVADMLAFDGCSSWRWSAITARSSSPPLDTVSIFCISDGRRAIQILRRTSPETAIFDKHLRRRRSWDGVRSPSSSSCSNFCRRLDSESGKRSMSACLIVEYLSACGGAAKMSRG